MTEKQFLQKIGVSNLSSIERAISLLWFVTINDNETELSCTSICKKIEDVGFGKQNPSRLSKGFSKDKRVVRGSGKSFKISAKMMPELTKQYSQFLQTIPIEPSDSVLDLDLFKNARGYTQKVLLQLNGSYDFGLFDCCAVMCRRLLETLIIEAYEEKRLSDEITGSDGNFFMFSGLLNHLESKKRIQLSRNALRGLKDFKKLGDLSAHNRRFNARKTDIDKIQPGLRIACEELLYQACQGP
ncbi:hypothetical protein [Desulfobacula sp.]|uniref:hypothetical protein n=1 Tax=Desulfobacula sp. TaxID=2593537 RepID=UPI002629F356|nr:hypothetical protein [Desulfobacula sp.]